MFRKLFLISFILCTACSAKDAQNAAVARLERKLNDLRSFQAEKTAEFAALQEEVRALNGRVEELEFRQGQVQATQPNNSIVVPGNTPAAVQEPAETVRDSIIPPPIVPIDVLEEDESLSLHLDAQIASMFQDALYFIRRGQYRQAIPLLDQVVTFGQGKQGFIQALFWKGVCFDGMGNNRDALASYNQIVQSQPTSDRARKALLRLASVFVRLGDTNTARLTLQKLITEAPESDEAKRAQDKIKDLS